MKRVFLFFCLSSFYIFYAQPITNSQVFNDSTLKQINNHVTYALNLHPALLYNSFLINEYFNKVEFKNSLKLFNAQRAIYKLEKNKFIDSLLLLVNNASINKFKKIDISDLINEFEEDIVISEILEKDTILLLKSNLKYDDNYSNYYQYCHFMKNFTLDYNKLINYKELLDLVVCDYFLEVSENLENYELLTDADKEKYVQNLLSKWYLVKELPSELKPDLFKLLITLYNNDYDVSYKAFTFISYNHSFVNYNYDKFQRFNNEYDSYYSMNLKQNYNLLAGLKLKLKDEISSFSWLDIIFGIGMNEITYNLDKSRSLLHEEPRRVGLRFGEINYAYYEKFNIAETNSKSNTYYLSLNTPFYYFTDWLYIAGGIEADYFRTWIKYQVSKDEYTVNTGTLETVEYATTKLYTIKEETSDLNFSPIINLNCQIFEFLTLCVSRSLNNSRVGLITSISF